MDPGSRDPAQLSVMVSADGDPRSKCVYCAYPCLNEAIRNTTNCNPKLPSCWCVHNEVAIHKRNFDCVKNGCGNDMAQYFASQVASTCYDVINANESTANNTATSPFVVPCSAEAFPSSGASGNAMPPDSTSTAYGTSGSTSLRFTPGQFAAIILATVATTSAVALGILLIARRWARRKRRRPVADKDVDDDAGPDADRGAAPTLAAEATRPVSTDGAAPRPPPTYRDTVALPPVPSPVSTIEVAGDTRPAEEMDGQTPTTPVYELPCPLKEVLRGSWHVGDEKSHM